MEEQRRVDRQRELERVGEFDKECTLRRAAEAEVQRFKQLAEEKEALVATTARELQDALRSKEAQLESQREEIERRERLA